jgi:hypothetical protein
MENVTRKIGLKVATGFIIALIIIVAVFASGITLPTQEDKSGKLTVLLMDAPVDVDELWITVAGVSVHRVGNEVQAETQEDENIENDEGSWVNISLSGADPDKLKFDLLKYRLENEGENSVLLNLAEGETAEGSYNKIRLNVTDAYALYYKYNENGEVVEDENGPIIATNQTLKVPPSHIDVITKFTIDERNPVVILIDMQPDWMAISNSGNLKPVLKATVSQEPVAVPIETIEA